MGSGKNPLGLGRVGKGEAALWGSAAGGEKSTRGALAEVSRVGETNLDQAQTLNDASNAENVERRRRAARRATTGCAHAGDLEDIAATSDRRAAGGDGSHDGS